jgi:hypothetical protein
MTNPSGQQYKYRCLLYIKAHLDLDERFILHFIVG